ncbi:rhodanese-like domain-containing protein [Flavobacteriaceae bacterium]|nr:rhodanese-like domain-containing protein [Flavobacteriaceae bacterium]MDA8947893.1 rhodanese-like domain-containing protein [Flavobacteriaceae bacterium]MDA9016221.1 rhodanese-like domain-containing protein [Flavobacteriaceae bacterium]MDA9571903.1 rhodanese-like domain-containing protein [Flavobacteriaceae bacterium]
MKKLFVLLLFISCTQETPVIETVEKETFEQLMQNDYPLIDVRTPQEFVGGHIENATNIDFNSPSFKLELSGLDKEQPFLIYCAVGGRSAKAASMMQSLGFKKVYELKGGYRNW